MKKIQFIYSVLGVISLILSSCQEDITIDTEKGNQKIGIYGGITTDLKQHTITISKTTGFYSQEDIEMVSGADVRIIDITNQDTFQLTENEKGEYLTEKMAGTIGHSYLLVANVPEDGQIYHFQSQSTIDTCPPQIDSIQVRVYTMLDIVQEEVFKICPYFQTSKENLYYLFDLEINGIAYSDTLSKKAKLHLGAMSGLYYNGWEMALIYKDLNVYPHGLFYLDQTLIRETLHIGDTIGITMQSIPGGYYRYIGDITSSIGSNPLMGSPTNVRTNIVGKEKEAVGYFYAASCIHFEQIIKSLPFVE